MTPGITPRLGAGQESRIVVKEGSEGLRSGVAGAGLVVDEAVDPRERRQRACVDARAPVAIDPHHFEPRGRGPEPRRRTVDKGHDMTTTTAAPAPTSPAPTKGRSRRRLQDFFLQNKDVKIDYKNQDLLRRFLSPEGKVLPGRRTGLTSKNQRKITRAIKRARAVGLLPFTNHEA
jgi:small subunit ribosomal protein S18